MTHNEKALELITFFDKIQIDSNKNIAYSFYHLGINDRKKMALKVINDIMQELGKLNVEVLHTNYGEKLTEINGEIRTNYVRLIIYWTKVKEEIEKL